MKDVPLLLVIETLIVKIEEAKRQNWVEEFKVLQQQL